MDLKKYYKKVLNKYFLYILIWKKYLDKLPEEIINIIKDYTPRDKDMKAPTAAHIKSLLDDYEDDPKFGTFYTYTQWICKMEKEIAEEYKNNIYADSD